MHENARKMPSSYAWEAQNPEDNRQILLTQKTLEPARINLFFFQKNFKEFF